MAIKDIYIGSTVYSKKLDRNILIEKNGNYINYGIDFIFEDVSNKQELEQRDNNKRKRKSNNKQS